MDELEQTALAGIKAHRTYADGKVTLDADVFDDLLEAARKAALAARSEPGAEALREAVVAYFDGRRRRAPAAEMLRLITKMGDSLAATPAADSPPEWPAVDCKVTFLHDHKTPDGYYGPWEGPHEAWDDGAFPDRVAPAADSRGRLVAAVRDWVDFGAGDGTEDAEATSQRLLERIAREYAALTDPDPR